MQKALLAVDRFSTFIGKTFAWTAVGLTLLISWEVFSRYVLNKPHAWVLDAQIMLYGTLFMTAGAYTLSKNGHVRGDVLYGFFRPRTQATLDLILYILFFLPGVTALTWAGWTFFTDSLAIREHVEQLRLADADRPGDQDRRATRAQARVDLGKSALAALQRYVVPRIVVL